MKSHISILFLLTLLFHSLTSEETSDYSMILKNVRKDVVKKAYSQLPSRKTTNILRMCHLMSSVIEEFSLNDYEKVYLVYYWIAYNIEIDCSYTGKYESAVTAYNGGKSTYVGISALFSTIISNLGLRSNIIEGQTKRTVSDPKGKAIFGELAHIWNYVMIDEKYYLFDPTYGIGSCVDDEFRHFYCELYFGTKPEILIRSHLPDNSRWQLLDVVVSKDKFESWPFITKYFYLFGFKTISPDTRNLQITKDLKITATYDDQKNNGASCNKVIYKGSSAEITSYYNFEFSDGIVTAKFTGNEKIDGFIIYSGLKDQKPYKSIVYYNVIK